MTRGIILTFMGFVLITAQASDKWFEQQTLLTSAHQKILENDIEGTFSVISEIWQQDPPKYVQNHLDKLLEKAIEIDCGKSLRSGKLPNWIKEVTVRRKMNQSSGRTHLSLILDVLSDEHISSIEIKQWNSDDFSSDWTLKTIDTERKKLTLLRKEYRLNTRLDSGLYFLTMTTEHGLTWATWIIMAVPQTKQFVRWQSNGNWKILKTGLKKKHCSPPILNLSLIDSNNGKSKIRWSQEYERDFPKSIPVRDLDAKKYVLSVTITHQRWQGSISIEDQQVINKTYGIKVD